MKRFRATVYHLSSMVEAAVGDEGISRRIIEGDAENPEMFKACIRDRWLSDVDADVSFGPISEVHRP